MMITFLQRLTAQCIAILLMCVAAIAQAGASITPLSPSKVEYTASYNGLPIAVTRELHVNQDGQYTLSSKAKSFLGKIEETGIFNLDESQNLNNHSYRYKRKILGTKRSDSLTYDYQNQLAYYSSDKKDLQIPLDQRYHNSISYQLQLQRDLANNCEELSYPIISKGKVKQYKFERIGDAVLTTPSGDINTIKIKRVREDNERETLMWFAPELGYLLVQIWQREDDEDYQISLKTGTINNTEITSLNSAGVRNKPQ